MQVISFTINLCFIVKNKHVQFSNIYSTGQISPHNTPNFECALLTCIEIALCTVNVANLHGVQLLVKWMSFIEQHLSKTAGVVIYWGDGIIRCVVISADEFFFIGCGCFANDTTSGLCINNF